MRPVQCVLAHAHTCVRVVCTSSSSAAAAQHGSLLHTSTRHLRGFLHTSTRAHNPPDLYEGSRSDRRPFPSPVPGLDVEHVQDKMQDDEHLPQETYPLQSDPSASTCHPDEKDIEAAKHYHDHDQEQGPRPRDADDKGGEHTQAEHQPQQDTQQLKAKDILIERETMSKRP